MADVTERKRRSGGRAGNTRRTSSDVIQQAPWIIPVNTDRPTEPLNEEGVEAIHNGAMRILEEIGIDFLNEEALDLFKEIGVKVNGSNVRMDREWVMEMVAKAPSEFTITPRNLDRQITIGGRNMVFGNVSSPPNYFDLETGKVPGTRKQCQDL